MITYNGIIEYFKEVANKHLQISSFSFGDIDDADLDKIEEYPLLHVGVTGANIDERVISYDINIMVIEIVDDKNDRKENEKYALSNTLLILQDLQTEFLKGSSIVTPETKLTGNSLSCSTITGNYNNRVVGWSTLMTIEGANESVACGIPYLPIMTWDYTTPTPPISKLVSNGYTWYSTTEKQEKHIFYDNDGGGAIKEYITTWKPIHDDDSIGNLTTGTTSGKIEYDFKTKSILIEGDDPVSMTASGKSTLSTNDIFFIKFSKLTGDANILFSLNTTSGLSELIQNGKDIGIKNSAGQIAPLPTADISGLPNDNPKISQADAVIRDIPLTVAIKIESSTKTRLYYNGNNYGELTNSNSITGLGNFYIGNKNNPSATQPTNFKVQELIYTNGVMTDEEIENTIEWLNAK